MQGDGWEVELSAAGSRKIAVIKEVRAITGVGLKEAKSIVDTAPSLVVQGVSRHQADVVVGRLQSVGATASVRDRNAAAAAPASGARPHEVILQDAGLRPYSVVEHIMVAADMDYDEARKLVDNPPGLVAKALPAADAEALVTSLEGLGARASHRPARPRARTPALQVRLLDAGLNDITVMMTIRDHANTSLAVAKDLVDAVPCVIAKGLDPFSAQRLCDRLTRDGATVVMEAAPAPLEPVAPPAPPKPPAPKPPPRTPKPAPAPAPAQTRGGQTVTLDRVGPKKLLVIKALRAHLNTSLRAAKSMAESAPVVVDSGLDSERATALITALVNAGASATITGDRRKPPPPPRAPDGALLCVRLQSYGRAKIRAIKAVRQHLPLGLKQAKDLVETAPAVIARGLSAEVANRLLRDLADAGASASIEVDDGRRDDGAYASPAPPPAGPNARLILTSYGSRKIHVIKEIRSITGLGLRESKQLVDSAPSVITRDIPAEQAAEFAQRIEAVGGTVRVEVDTGDNVYVAPSEDDATYQILLRHWGRKKIAVIKEVRTLTGLGLRDAKNLVESAPCVILRGLDKDTAIAHSATLVGAGANIEMERDS